MDDTIIEFWLLFSTFSYWMPKSTSRITRPKELHLSQTYISYKMPVKKSSSALTHQSSNFGHHPRQLSCISLISAHCFSAWHKVEIEHLLNEACLLLFPLCWTISFSTSTQQSDPDYPLTGWLLLHQPLSWVFYSLYFFFTVYYFL